MSDFTAIFDNHDLSTLFVIEPVSRQLTTWNPALAENVIGSIATGTKAQPLEVTLDLTTVAATPQARLTDLRTLSAWLAVDEPKPLVLTDEVAYYYNDNSAIYAFRYAMPSGTPTITRALNADTARVKFVCPDPRAYAINGTFPYSQDPRRSGRLDILSSQTVTGTISGTAPTKPRFDLHNVRGDSSGTFELSIIAGNHTDLITLSVAPDASFSVIVDCESRRVIDRTDYPITVDIFDAQIDWPSIMGGTEYTFTVTKGYGLGTIWYYPRWW